MTNTQHASELKLSHVLRQDVALPSVICAQPDLIKPCTLDTQPALEQS